MLPSAPNVGFIKPLKTTENLEFTMQVENDSLDHSGNGRINRLQKGQTLRATIPKGTFTRNNHYRSKVGHKHKSYKDNFLVGFASTKANFVDDTYLEVLFDFKAYGILL